MAEPGRQCVAGPIDGSVEVALDARIEDVRAFWVG